MQYSIRARQVPLEEKSDFAWETGELAAGGEHPKDDDDDDHEIEDHDDHEDLEDHGDHKNHDDHDDHEDDDDNREIMVKVRRARISDSAFYQCGASNPFGSSNRTILLRVQVNILIYTK